MRAAAPLVLLVLAALAPVHAASPTSTDLALRLDGEVGPGESTLPLLVELDLVNVTCDESSTFHVALTASATNGTLVRLEMDAIDLLLDARAPSTTASVFLWLHAEQGSDLALTASFAGDSVGCPDAPPSVAALTTHLLAPPPDADPVPDEAAPEEPATLDEPGPGLSLRLPAGEPAGGTIVPVTVRLEQGGFICYEPAIFSVALAAAAPEGMPARFLPAHAELPAQPMTYEVEPFVGETTVMLDLSAVEDTNITLAAEITSLPSACTAPGAFERVATSLASHVGPRVPPPPPVAEEEIDANETAGEGAGMPVLTSEEAVAVAPPSAPSAALSAKQGASIDEGTGARVPTLLFVLIALLLVTFVVTGRRPEQ